MIDVKRVTKYCCEDISSIEGYEEAVCSNKKEHELVTSVWASPVDQLVKNLSAIQKPQETQIGSLGWERSPGGAHGNLL